jgi:hypothetical protein
VVDVSSFFDVMDKPRASTKASKGDQEGVKITPGVVEEEKVGERREGLYRVGDVSARAIGGQSRMAVKAGVSVVLLLQMGYMVGIGQSLI